MVRVSVEECMVVVAACRISLGVKGGGNLRAKREFLPGRTPRDRFLKTTAAQMARKQRANCSLKIASYLQTCRGFCRPGRRLMMPLRDLTTWESSWPLYTSRIISV